MMIYNHVKLKTGSALMLLLLSAGAAKAQFTSGSSFYIAPGTPVVIDSLTLQPAVTAVNLSNTTLTVSHVPIPPAGSGPGSIARVYEFDPAITLRGAMGVYYLDSELNGNTAGSLSFVYDNGSGVFNDNSVVTSSNTNNYVVGNTGAGTVSVRRITSVNAGSPLPVDLLSFTAEAEGSRTLVKWTTAQEFNCDHFDVERSADGRTFSFLIAEDAIGNSSSEHSYRTYDEQPLQGWNYYRLKQVDADGTFTWSPAAAVFFGDKDAMYVSVYPNPVQHQLSVAMSSMDNRSSSLVLMDATGRVLKSRELQLVRGNNTFSLDMNDLAAGSYLLKIGATFQAKVVKSK